MAEEKKKRRKRKDSTCALKLPLDFIESPLNGQKYYCTPVQAARRPFLAASLPVDDEVSMKWVSPQFSNQVENDEDLLALIRPNKKARGRRKKQQNAQSVSEESSSNKQLYVALEFQSKSSKSGCKEDKENTERQCRRSQRVKLKEIKRTHFLFQAPQVTTPVNKKGEVVLAYETPDQEFFKEAKNRQSRLKQGEIDPRSLESWCIRGTDQESTLRKDSSVP